MGVTNGIYRPPYQNGIYRPPYQRVSIVDIRTAQQVEFDTPEDFVRWLDEHPEVHDRLKSLVWTTSPIQGGH